MAGGIANVMIAAVLREDTGEFFELTEPMEFEVVAEREQTQVFGMGRRDSARGLREGPLKVSGSATIPRDVAPEIRWQEWLKDNIPFALVSQAGEGGNRDAYVGCKLSNVSSSYSAESREINDSVEWTGINLRIL